MKKCFTLLLTILVLISMTTSVYASDYQYNDNSSTKYKNVSVNLLDLDGWTGKGLYENATVESDVTQATGYTDIINMAMSSYKKSNLNKILEIVDNGAVLVVQNDTNYTSCKSIIEKMGIKAEQSFLDINEDGTTLLLGCQISNGSTGYKVSPIVATVMKAENDTSFDLSKELKKLKDSGDAYIDPIDSYCIAKENQYKDLAKSNSSKLGLLQLRISQAHTSASGFGYLYGKNGTAVWGQKEGYTLFGYIESSAYIIRETTKSGNKYDAVESFHTATGRGNKHVESYKIFNKIEKNCSMEHYAYINQQNTYTLSTGYTWTPNGFQTSITQSTTINPGSQKITTAKTNGHVLWSVTPNSPSANQSWCFEGSCLTKTAVGSTATVSVGFDELVVDNAALEYTSPCAIALTVSYS